MILANSKNVDGSSCKLIAYKKPIDGYILYMYVYKYKYTVYNLVYIKIETVRRYG